MSKYKFYFTDPHNTDREIVVYVETDCIKDIAVHVAIRDETMCINTGRVDKE